MKIAFPIFRFNWYRTVAPVVDEALKRGHSVECWHNTSSENTGQNLPSESMFPRFRNGLPNVRNYSSSSELTSLLGDTDADVIVSIDIPLDHWTEEPWWNDRTFEYAAIATPDTLRRITTVSHLDSVDLICVRSEHELQSCILDHTTDYHKRVNECERVGRDGDLYKSLMRPKIGKEWDQVMRDEFLKKCRITGYPLLDSVDLVDKNAFRKKLGIPSGKKVIGLWSTPHEGRGFHGHWDRIFYEKNFIKRLLLVIRGYGLKLWKFPKHGEERVIEAISTFAKNNNAVLVTKQRHYQADEPNFYVNHSDIMLGEDSFYPHSALELASIADLMIGFRTTGTTEAVYAGCPVLDLVIPNARRDLHFDAFHFLKGLYSHGGVVWSIPTDLSVAKLPSMKLEEFKMDESAKGKYIRKYCGPENGGFSSNILNEIEALS